MRAALRAQAHASTHKGELVIAEAKLLLVQNGLIDGGTQTRTNKRTPLLGREHVRVKAVAIEFARRDPSESQLQLVHFAKLHEVNLGVLAHDVAHHRAIVERRHRLGALDRTARRIEGNVFAGDIANRNAHSSGCFAGLPPWLLFKQR